MYLLQHSKRMSSTTANIAPAPIKEVTKTSTAKNRTAQITELFNALPLVEGFPLSTEQMWVYFNKACQNKDIKLRKLTTKSVAKSAEEGPKRLSGYNIFTRDFKGEIPEGVKMMTHKAAQWKALTEEEQKTFNDKARTENEANGLQAKSKKPTLEERQAEWEIQWKQWMNQDEATRGPEPERPKKATRKKVLKIDTSSNDTSDDSD